MPLKIKLPPGFGKQVLTSGNPSLHFYGWSLHGKPQGGGSIYNFDGYKLDGAICYDQPDAETMYKWLLNAKAWAANQMGMNLLIPPAWNPADFGALLNADAFAAVPAFAVNAGDVQWNEALAEPQDEVIKKKPKASHMQLLKVGADVELFLVRPDRVPVPCVQLVGGTKEKPIPILTELGEGYAIQEDNVMLEYNIPPANTVHDFVYSLRRVNEEIARIVSRKGLIPAIEASMRFTEADLSSDQAKVFGCEPDFNVWERCPNEKPELPEDAKTLRTAGGHVHVSFNVNGEPPKFPEQLTEMEAVVMGMDIFLGVPSVILDKDRDRKRLYGKAGAFRRKPYGIEWRTSSNWWTKNPEYMAFVFQQVMLVFSFIQHEGLASVSQRWRKSKDQVQAIINRGLEQDAAYYCKQLGIQLP